MSRELYEHQREAVERFKDEDDIMLFFEQGCGKSATALKLAEWKFRQGKIEQLLVIAPNDVHRQWATEQCPEWLDVPYEAVCFGGRGGAREFYDPTEPGRLGVVCVNIDTFSSTTKWHDVVSWATKRNTMLVLDEATVIKNVESKRTQLLLTEFNDIKKQGKRLMSSTKKSTCRCRCVLTGTPVTNGPMDLWAITEFVHPNFFGHNWWTFRQRYGMFTKLTVNGRDVPILLNEKTWAGVKRCENYAMAFNVFGCSEDTYFTVQSQSHYMGPYKHAEELKQQLDKSAVFRKLVDCLDMPEQVFVVRELTMNPEQERAYRTMKAQQIAEYQGHVVTALNKLTMATRLQQISSGFLYEKSDDPEDLLPDQVTWLGKSNPKLETLERDVAESDKPVLVLTRYTAEAAKIYDMLSKDYSCMLYTGWKKTGTVEQFKDGQFEVMVANIACVARGFNFQLSHSMFFYSNTFSMELREQALARVFRAGQHHTCKYTDYMFRDTVDEVIMQALKNKQSMLEYFRTADIELT